MTDLSDAQFSRVCPRCQRRRPIDAYPRNRSKPTGRGSYCKSCHSTGMREYGATEHGRIAMRAARGRWQERHLVKSDRDTTGPRAL